ncbi:MAG: hypothetical protein WDW36_004477 [Sanguina aurantia]
MITNADARECAGNRSRPGLPAITPLAAFALRLLVCFFGLGVTAAHAGSLYKCTGSSGETVFSSSTAGYRGCKKIASYSAPSRSATGSSSRGRSAMALPSSLNLVSGSVETTARSLAADGVDPVSLDRVRGSVESSGRLDGQMQTAQPSLKGIRGSADSTATLPLADAIVTADGAGPPSE